MEKVRTLILVPVLAQVLDVMLHRGLAPALDAALDSLQLRHACNRAVTQQASG
jgi:hypothetical protein